jgi:hypothetical protein
MSHKLSSGVEIVPIEQMWSSIWEIEKTKIIGDTLAKTYPGYQWWVRARAEAGYFVIHCGEINSVMATNQPYGMLMHVSKMDDHGLLVKKIVRMGGELLERANLIRGKSKGDVPTHIDGLPKRYQPLKVLTGV